jgi:hypothetical protein
MIVVVVVVGCGVGIGVGDDDVSVDGRSCCDCWLLMMWFSRMKDRPEGW